MIEVKVLVEKNSEKHNILLTFLNENNFDFSYMPIVPRDIIRFHYTPPFRIGRKQKRAVLDNKGLEVKIFPKGDEKLAEVYCKALNKEFL